MLGFFIYLSLHSFNHEFPTKKKKYKTQYYFSQKNIIRKQKNIGQPSLNLTYLAFERGPVPKEIYNNRKSYNSPLFKFLEIENHNIQIIPKQKAKSDLDYFSPYEIKLMNKLIEIYASGYVDTNMISDCSHKEILAWKRTFEKTKNGVIDYSLTFKDDIYEKKEELLTVQEETFKT